MRPSGGRAAADCTFFSAARGEERIALVIANPAYDNAPAIANAEMSAELVAASLRSLGFAVRQVADGDRADVAHAMYDFAKSLDAADFRRRLLLYRPYRSGQ